MLHLCLANNILIIPELWLHTFKAKALHSNEDLSGLGTGGDCMIRSVYSVNKLISKCNGSAADLLAIWCRTCCKYTEPKKAIVLIIYHSCTPNQFQSLHRFKWSAQSGAFKSNKPWQMTMCPGYAELSAGSGQSLTSRTFALKGEKLFGCHVAHYMLVGSFCFLFFDATPVLSNSSFSWMYSCLHCS